jgi:hypothetical protein
MMTCGEDMDMMIEDGEDDSTANIIEDPVTCGNFTTMIICNSPPRKNMISSRRQTGLSL